MWGSLLFAGSFTVTALAVVSCGLLYLLLGLTQILLAATEFVAPTPDKPSGGMQQIIGALSPIFARGEILKHLNQSAFAAAAVLLSLVALLIFIEEALLRVKEKLREWARLPSPEVLHYYNRNSYDTALAGAGRGLSLKKGM
ncbi:hypothetical protein LSCM1_01196 [Leishmania martiniquensis]|uniref:Uncharacterized protein n=1 Tax=Leishmania martiniquensis TaxID=1580590 RepID=A0A836KC90_9TRYP|nr:hypothetical protein LSCM1_01196 [Leishmania martiniquensis]